MRQAVALAEFAHPVCHAVRVHGAAVLLREDKALILVEFTQPQPLGVLPCAIGAEKLHCLCRERNIAVRRGRLRGILVDSAIRGVQDIVANMDTVLLEVNGAPFQAQQLPAPCAGQQEQVRQRLPFQRLLFERVADGRDLLRLEVVHFPLGNLRKRGLCRDVEGNLSFLLRLVKNRRDQPVMLQNGLCRQAGTGALVLPRLAERRIEAIQMVGPQVFQLDMTDSRIDALGQLLIADDRGVLRSALLLHGNYIFAVRLKLLAAVSGHARSAFLLKGRGESLGLFSCALFRPSRRNLERSCPRLQLLPIRPPPAMNADGIGDQPPGLVAAFLDVCHCYTSQS